MTEQNTKSRSTPKQKGIFCLETESWDKRKRKTPTIVEPVLRLLEQVIGIDYLYRDIATLAELIHFLKQYTKKSYGTYPIPYLGFRGFCKENEVGLSLNDKKKRSICLDEIQKVLQDSLEHRVVYFGACEIMKARNELWIFWSETKAATVNG